MALFKVNNPRVSLFPETSCWSLDVGPKRSLYSFRYQVQLQEAWRACDPFFAGSPWLSQCLTRGSGVWMLWWPG